MAPDKPPLVLLHPILCSGRIWDDVVPLLSHHHEVYTPTLLGHRGGPSVQRHPATIIDVIDAAERFLDDQQLARPHLVGNSTGGYVAIELARRGRAATVCALSPAGFWSIAEGLDTRAANKVRRIAAIARITRPVAPAIFRSATVRRLSFRKSMPRTTQIDYPRRRPSRFSRTSSRAPLTSARFTTNTRSTPWTPCHARSPSHGPGRTHCFRSRHTERSRASACPGQRSRSCPTSATHRWSMIPDWWPAQYSG